MLIDVDISQDKLLNKLEVLYKKYQEKDPLVWTDREYSSGGICQGYSILFLYTHWLSTQPKIDPTKPRDDAEWFNKVVLAILNWDKKSEIDVDLAKEIDRFLQLVCFFQRPSFSGLPYEQGHLFDVVEDDQNYIPVDTGSIAGVFDKQQFPLVLKAMLVDATYALLRDQKHTMAIFKEKGVFYFFDSSDDENKNTRQFNSLDDLAAHFIEKNFLPTGYLSLCIGTFAFQKRTEPMPITKEARQEKIFSLLDKHAIKTTGVMPSDGNIDALQLSIYGNYIESVAYYLNHYPCLYISTDATYENIIFNASATYYWDVVELLILKLIDDNAAIPQGQAVLSYAIKHDQIKIVDHLLRAGVEITDESLLVAARKVNPTLFQHLLQQRVKIPDDDKLKKRLLTEALDAKAIETARWLIKEGCSLNSVDDPNGYWTLYYSNLLHDLTSIDMLQQLGIFIHIEYNNQTFLHLAARDNDVVKINALLAAGVDPNKKNNFSETALFIALENKNFAAASLLIQHGAKISLPDSSASISKSSNLSKEKYYEDENYQIVFKHLFVTPLKTAAIGYQKVLAHDKTFSFFAPPSTKSSREEIINQHILNEIDKQSTDENIVMLFALGYYLKMEICSERFFSLFELLKGQLTDVIALTDIEIDAIFSDEKKCVKAIENLFCIFGLNNESEIKLQLEEKLQTFRDLVNTAQGTMQYFSR